MAMEWVRGNKLGHGSFATVNLAIPSSQSSQFLPLMAVKSCGASHSASLVNEKLILNELGGCPEIIRCLGDSFSFENGEKLYNVLLEYAAGGSLAEKLKNCGDHGLPDSEVRGYTKAVFRGLLYIHKYGYVHCDIKLQNILLGPNGDLKIADFGLAKKAGVKRDGSGGELRGTPLYMSPEMVAGGQLESPADIWALGCVVAELSTGAPAWRCRQESDVAGLLMRIGATEDVPEIPGKLSEQGKDFLGKCFVKDPKERWTAEMLLNHPFIADQDDDDHHDAFPSTSPRCPFDFPDWVTEQSSMTCSSSITSLAGPEYSPKSMARFEAELLNTPCGFGPSSSSPAERLRRLVNDQKPNWSVLDNWVTVR